LLIFKFRFLLFAKKKKGGGIITFGGVEGESRYACFFYVFRDGGSISCHKMKTCFFWLQEMAVEMNTVVCFCFACTAHQTRKKMRKFSGVGVSITCEEMKSWI